MGKKSKAATDMQSTALLLFICRKKVPLIAITLTAFVVSIIVSFVITPRYSSSVVLYPAPVSSMALSLSKSAISRDIMSFGRESDAERLLQVLHSDVIRERMIEKYDLMEHYGIDTDSRFPYTALNRKYNNNVRFRKTRYMAIEIEVLDTDPAIAATMANDIAGYVDSVMNSMLKERAQRLLVVAENEYRGLKEEVLLLEDSLRKIREMGVINYEAQSETLSDAYAQAVLSRDTVSMDYFRQRINTLSFYGGIYVSLRDNLVLNNERLNDLNSIYKEARINAEEKIPYKYIVNEAREAEKKAYPVRSLIVAVSTIAAFLLTLFGLLLADAFRKQVLNGTK